LAPCEEDWSKSEERKGRVCEITMSSKTSRFMAILLAVSMLLIGLAGCSGGKAKIPTNTLVVGMADDVDVLDPAVTSTNSSWSVTYWTYERLVDYKTQDGKGLTEVGPALATDWTVSPDGLVWTFNLRKDSKFDDGTPVTADAVKYTFDRLKAIGKGPWDTFPTLAKVDVLDPYKVQFTLNAPFPPFLYTLATNAGSIVNPKVVKAHDNGDNGQAWLSEHTAGSGPYMLKEWVKDQYHKLVVNPYYHGPAPALKTVMIKIIKDPSARRLQLEKGDLDVAEELPLDQLDKLSTNPDVNVLQYPSMSVCYVYLNTQKPPLNNVKFRQALSYATDYAGIIKGVQLGRAKQMKGPVPEGMWGADPDAMQFTYDLNKAKQLLAESKVKTPLTLTYLYADRSPDWEPIGLALQASFKELGIKLELQKLAYSSMREKLDKGDFQLAIGNWTPDYGDPFMFMNYWFDSKNFGLAGNRAFYKNPQVDDLVRKAATITDQAERTKLYIQASKLIMEDAPYIYLYQRNYTVAMRKNVQGYVFNPMLVDMFNFHQMSKTK